MISPAPYTHIQLTMKGLKYNQIEVGERYWCEVYKNFTDGEVECRYVGEVLDKQVVTSSLTTALFYNIVLLTNKGMKNVTVEYVNSKGECKYHAKVRCIT